MSTRSIIVITGEPQYNGTDQTIRLYKHSDGYPTGNLPVIRDALKKALEQRLADVRPFKHKSTEERILRPEQVAALCIGESASVYGFGAKLDTYEKDKACYYTGITNETLGNQGDLEWIYVVDLKKFTLNTYNGDQSNVLKNKTENPESYVMCLIDDCRTDELKEIRELVASIEALGFSVNKKAKRSRKAA